MKFPSDEEAFGSTRRYNMMKKLIPLISEVGWGKWSAEIYDEEQFTDLELNLESYKVTRRLEFWMISFLGGH